MELSVGRESDPLPNDVGHADQTDDPRAAADVLADALTRAAEQRLAAEQLLEQARLLEDRITAEVVQAQIARAHAERERLATVLKDAESRESAARERSRQSMRTLEGHSREVTRAKSTLQELRRIEDGARADADEAATALDRAQSEREHAEKELNAVIDPGPATGAPSLAVVDELRALEARLGLSAAAAKRVAERRLADAARRESTPPS